MTPTIVEDTCRCGAAFRVSERVSAYAAMKHVAWLNAHRVCRATSDVATAERFGKNTSVGTSR